MGVFQVVLILATFLCSLVAGFLFAFAVVAMPGIGKLNDREFIRAFQVMDGIIQNNQPIFLLVWVGSVIALLAAALLGLGRLDGVERLLLIIATLAYLFGVQFPSATINIPLNNKIQAFDADATDAAAQNAAREEFQPRWNQWNRIRTIFASAAAFGLLVLVSWL